MAVGEIFLSAFVQLLFQQLATTTSMALARREKVENHFRKLSQSFEVIVAVLSDAEEKQLTDKSVKLWMETLRDLAYDMDDILDEITTRFLIQKSKEIEHPRRASMVWKLIPACSNYTPGALLSNYRMMSRINNITCRLQLEAEKKNKLRLSENVGGISKPASETWLPTTELVNESDIFGRDDDKDVIIKRLLMRYESSPYNFITIPIVGMGGIGKTTLAQLVYNDIDVKKNFHARAWVCVSVKFDVVAITKIILGSMTGTTVESNDLNMLQVSLHEKLSKSKFLIVLDDVWEHSYNEWDLLCRPFQSGSRGSRIIVTTRIVEVASLMASPQTAHEVEELSPKDCLSVLALHSRKPLHGNRVLEKVVNGLVKKCDGLPLAAKTLGGLLRTKETKEEWEDVQNSKIWDLPKENNILPVLRLSYHYLPPHLKHLFAYCSIFPKDYEFDKTELVLLWMGEGFLEKPDERKTKEELGIQYFNDLLSRSFFQRSRGFDSIFVMHDLMNDLAQFVAGGTCYRLDEKMDTTLEYELFQKVRHASFLRHEYEVFKKFRAFYEVQGLRTFLPMPVQNSRVWPPFYLSNKILVELVPSLHSLRVLSLSGYSITELPGSVCNLIHLRYLNLSGTSIVTLPDYICGLYCLQTLSISNCRFISKLPPTLGNLYNLRHLDNSNTDQLKDMPIEIGKLNNLQTLPKVVLGRVGGLGLKELGNFKLLRGKLAIHELQNVTDVEHVKEADLRCKEELDELQLTWGRDADSSCDKISEENVIGLLEPHGNLKKLNIEFYRGAKFPSWIGNPLFGKLSAVTLSGCSECTSLPPLGQLTELKELHIRYMSKVKSIGIEFYGTGANIPFQKLEILRFNNMPEWEKWSSFGDSEDSDIQFPNLQQLAMLNCEKLTNISPLSFPALCRLDLEECSMMVLERFRDLDKLNHLRVETIPGISHLPKELMQSLAALEDLECCNCKELQSLWPSDMPVDHLIHLRRLVVAHCSKLVSLGEGEYCQLPCNLEVLELFGCSNLMSLPNDLSNIQSLRELIIQKCPKLISFPENGIPPMLKRLEILSCDALKSLPTNVYDLERLEVKECPSLTTWSTVNFPTYLKKLSIKNCTHLKLITESMFPPDGIVSLEELSLCNFLRFSNLLKRLNGFSNLVELYLYKCSRLKHFPEQGLPPYLRALSLDSCANLKSFPASMKDMTSLLSLELRSCPNLEEFPKYDLPANLSALRIWDSKTFKPLAKWGLQGLKNLREFSICGGFKELQLLGPESPDNPLFPPSLKMFSISRFPNLTSLCKVLDDLTMLQHLSIMNCAKLTDLPNERLLERLWRLEISGCKLLTPRCVKGRGDYWSKISGIPCVKIEHVHKQS